MSTLKLATNALHAGHEVSQNGGTRAVPIYQTSSYVFNNSEHAANLFSLKELGFIYTRLNNQISGATGQMKWMGYLMPIVFMGVLNNVAAGLNYYYFVANMMTFGQQWLIRKFVDDSKLHKQIQENKKKPASAKKSNFQQKLEDMQKAREKQLKAKK